MTATESNTTDVSASRNHVFVDYENVHAIDLEVIDDRTTTFTILLGRAQTKLDVGLVEQLLANKGPVEIVRLTSSGRNAVDFALAYHLGRAVEADPMRRYFIVTKDKGYDPLLSHLRSKGIRADRYESFSTLPFSDTARSKSATQTSGSNSENPPINGAQDSTPEGNVGEWSERFCEHLISHPGNRPKRRSTLLRHIKTHFGNRPTDAEVEEVIVKLCCDGRLAIDDKGTLTYTLTRIN